ncbi:MAG: hypothetical protein Q4G69_04855 [Planctomycetia bacterium]|nr:hypothetical protein [Planctomycetia bacterium]
MARLFFLFLIVLLICRFSREIRADGFSDYYLSNAAAKTNADNPSWSELFETSGVSWRYLFKSGKTNVLGHYRSTLYPHTGRQSEEIRIDFPEQGEIILGHYLDYPILTDETKPSLWVRSDRTGITLGALVVLPKTIRPDTQTPLVLLIRGSSLKQAGEWEKLEFGAPIRILQETIQAIRGEHNLSVESEGAYIRQIVLIVEGNRKRQTLFIDDLQLMEHLPCSPSLLQWSEKNNGFIPINLLAFRIAATNRTVFPDTDNTMGLEEEEPYRIGTPLLSSPASGEKTYQAARQKIYEKIGKQTDDLSPGFKEGNAVVPIGAAQIPEKIGQVDYLFGNSPSGDRVAAAQYSSKVSVPKPNDGSAKIVSGSGTLSDSGKAAAFTVGRGPLEKVNKIEFKGKYLTLDNYQQLGVCAIEYQGEPLSFLKNLGFNAVWLKKAPSAQILQEAKNLNLWLIAPPPIGTETVETGNGGNSGPPNTGGSVGADALPYFNRRTVDPIYDSVLIWDMGTNYRKADLKKFQANANLIRILDRKGRPVVCNVDTGISEYTYRNDTDLLLIRRQPLLTSLDMCDYARWLFGYPKLVLPEFPVWNEIQTQPDVQLLAQTRYFGATDELPSLISYEQIRQQVRLSLAAGCHGILFASNTPLNSLDHETQYRACALELINWELLLLHPWFAGGNSEEVLDSNNEQVSAVLQKVKQTTLLVPVSAEEHNQYQMGQTAWNNISFVAPVRDGYNVEIVAPGGLQRIVSKRKAGGVYLDLDELSMNSMLFLTQSDWYNQEMAEKAPLFGPRMSELAIRLAKMRYDVFQKTLNRLKAVQENRRMPYSGKKPLLPLPELDTLNTSTQRVILEAEQLYKNEDYQEAWFQAERATREIRLTERRFWLTATANEICRPVLPVSISFSTLPAYLENYKRINGKEIRLVDENRIQGGDMENLSIWTNGPWARFQDPVAGVRAEVMLDLGSAHSGSYGLRFRNQKESEQSPAYMENPPETMEVRIPVRTGEMICFQGWIKIPEDLKNTVDGFFIYDDHGGPALGLRFTKKTDWRQFAFYRFASYDGEMKFRFSLSGYGDAWIDDVSAHVVK